MNVLGYFKIREAESYERDANGELLIKRYAFEREGTLLQDDQKMWSRGHPATHFALLDKVSCVGQGSVHLTRAWNNIKNELAELKNRGLIV